MTLQEHIQQFVDVWGPRDSKQFLVFRQHLRVILNIYARAAIQHGNIPEEGEPHGGLNSASNPAWRVRVKCGRNIRVLVFESDPQVKVGDDMPLLDDEGTLREWIVTKVEKTEILVKVPFGGKRG